VPSAARPPGVLRIPGPDDGDRPAVVAVPGLGLSVEVPARTLRRLRPVGTCTAVALPGYGEPGARDAALDPASLAAGLLDRLDALGVARAVLIGHSASCQIVVEAAGRAPTRVAGLVLIGPTTDPRADRWSRLAARWLRTAAWERPHQVPLLVRDYGRTGPVRMGRAMDAARRHRIDRAVARVRCPVLVVRGRHDRIAPGDWTAALAAAAPRGRATDLPAGAHMVPITHPGDLAAAIGGFVHHPR
jgi:pimeloyl-ACP methyl ester carboxylesterase